MKLGLYLLPGHSLIKFRSVKYSKQQYGINPSSFAKFYLMDMSQQAANLHTFGPIVVAQKVVWVRKTEPLSPKED